MCDTLVVVTPEGVAFAKNSDREPSEPQLIHRLPAAPARRVDRATYIEVPTGPSRHAVVLSRPGWIFGAEMGVNEHGLAIGNEAVFSKLVDRRGKALLGMDLLRLALERCATAREAIDEITRLIDAHGQGGPAGFRDRGFRYDSSFLLADPREAWILETAGSVWVARQVKAGVATISNRYGIGREWDLAAPDLHDVARRDAGWSGKGDLDFAATFDSFFMPRLGRAASRAATGRACFSTSAAELPDAAALLAWARHHAGGDGRPGSNADVCMHATGILRPSQTTSTMLAWLRPGAAPEIEVTGTSAPCLSITRPVGWEGGWSVLDARDEMRGGVEPWLDAVWARQEWVHRRALFDERFAAAWRDALDTFERNLDRRDRPSWDAEAEDLAARWQAAARADWRLPPGLSGADRHWRRLARLDGFLSPRGPNGTDA